MIRNLFPPSSWQQLLKPRSKRERAAAIKEAVAGRYERFEALESRIAPATLASLSGGSISVLGDQGGAGEIETLTFTISGSDLHITDPTHAITAGAGFAQVNANDVSIPLASITGLTGNFAVNTGTGADTVTVSAALNVPVDVALSSGGSIAEAAGGTLTTPGTLTTHSVTGTLLTNANSVGAFNGTNTGTGDIRLTNAGPLSITGIAGSGIGNVTIVNTGSIGVNGAITNSGGNVNLTALAVSFSVVSDATWTRSGVTEPGGPSATWTPSGNPPPAAATFTNPVTIAFAGGIDITDVSGVGGGAQPIASDNDVHFFRKTFNLPVATGISASVVTSMDNGGQIFLNGQEVAREVSFDGANFSAPFPAFNIGSNGTISAVSQFDQLAPSFTNWIAGTNELIFAMWNPNGEGAPAGGFVFRMDVTSASSITVNANISTGPGGNAVLTASDQVVFAAPVTTSGSVSASGNAVTVNAPVRANSISLAGATNLNANLITSGGSATLLNNVTLGANVLVDTTNGGLAAGAGISFNGTINGANALVLTGGIGNVTISGSVGGSIPLAGLTLTAADFNASAIGLASAAPLSVSNSGTASTISGAISGAGATLAKAGPGTLVLGSANSYSGTTSINEGTLKIGASGAIPAASALVISSGGSPGLIHRYSFSETGGSGTTLIDSVGGANGTIVEVGSSNATVGGGTVTIGGGLRANSDYVSLPGGMMSPLTDATIELWGTQLSVQNWGRVFDVGDNINDYLMMSWSSGSVLNSDRVEHHGPGAFTVDDTNQPYTLGQKFHIAMTIDQGGGAGGTTRITWFKDGVQRGTTDTTFTLAQLTDTAFNLSRSFFPGDATGNDSYDEVRIYNRALTPAEIQADTISGPDGYGAGGTLDLGGFSAVVAGLDGTGTITNSAGASTSGLTVNGGGNYSGSIQNGGTGGVVALTKAGAGTLTLSGNNAFTGATTVSAGALALASTTSNNNIANSTTVSVATGATLNVLGLDNGLVTDTLALASGQTLVGSGSVSGKLLVASGAAVAPGGGPAILNTGDVAFASGSTFSVEVNGNTPGIGHDQLNVTGTVALGGSTLSSTGTIASLPGQTIVLINNDGADAVTGTFNGLPEGSVVTINSIPFVLSYVGGTGNDVTLIQAQSLIHLDGSGNLVIDDVATGNDDQITLQSDTANGRFVINDPNLILTVNIPGATGNGTNTVFVPFASVPGNVLVNTFAGNDSLNVNFSLGNFSKTVTFDGGTQTTGDVLTLSGGTFASVVHTFTNASSGSVAITGNSLISYTGLEPIVDNLGAADRTFTFNGGTETITLVDSGGADGQSTIDSTAGESVTFTNPSASITINGGSGDDTITITSIDAAFAGTLAIDGGAATDSVSFGVGLPALLGLSSTSETLGVLPSLDIGFFGLTLNVSAGGISQSGNLLVGGATTLTAAGAIALGNTSNDFLSPLTLTATAAGGITVNDNNFFFVTSATTTDGAIALATANGVLAAGTIVANGAGQNVTLSTTGSGNIAIDDIQAAGDTITINSAGAIEEAGGGDAGTDLTAGILTLTSASGIGGVNQIQVAATTLGTATVTGTGNISIRSVGSLAVTNASTADGTITFLSDAGTLALTSVSAGNAGTITLSTTASGDITLGNVTTAGTASANAAGAIEELGADATADISAASLSLTAVNGIGAAAALEIAATTLTSANVTGTGAINLSDTAGGLNVTSATTADGAITINAIGGDLALTSVTAGGAGRNVSLSTTTSGAISLGNIIAAGDSVTIGSAGTIEELGADGGADVTANSLTITSGTSFGAAAAIETAVGNFAATTTGSINLANTGALTTGIVNAGAGTITISAASPLTVAANMTSAGDILLTAGEISDAPAWADDFTLTGLATIQSTAGSIALRAGDEITLSAGTTVNAAGTVTLQSNFNDVDASPGTLTLLGTIISGAALNFSSPGDIVLGLINAPGQTVTLTADSDNNGTGGIYRDGVTVTNVIASTLIASASTRIASLTDPGAYGIHLVTQVSNLTATVANGAGDISIGNSGGALAVTSATTSNGNVTLSHTGGTLTLSTITAGGAANISITTTGAGSNVLTGSLNAAGDTITINSSGSIDDNNAAATNFAALNLSLTAVTGIGAADALESTVSNLVAINITGNIQVNNAGALTINGANVTGATGGITINAASPITIAANESAPGAISHTAGEISDSPSFADDLVLNAGISVTSTGSSVSLLAGDDIVTNAGSTIGAATTVTLTAASGDLDNAGGIQHGGAITAAGNVVATARDTIAIGGNITSTAANVALTSTVQNITRSAGTVSGSTVTLSANAGSIGAVGAPVLTTAAALVTSSSTDQTVTESDGATVTSTSTTGTIRLVTTAGNWGTNAITTAGNVFMTATAGSILDNNAAAVNVTAAGYVAIASTGVGTSADSLETTIANFEAQTTSGGIFISETNALTIGGVSATTGAIATAGDIVINSGALTIAEDITTPNNVTLNSTGTITETTGAVKTAALLTTDSVGGQTLSGANTVVTFDADNVASGNISLTNTAATLAVIKITNPVGNATVTNAGNVQLGDASNQNINISGTASITATGAAISDGNGAANNITALSAVLLSGTGVGTAGAIDTNIASLEAAGGTGGVFVDEANGLNIGGVSAVTGVSATGVVVINSGALTIQEDIVTPNNVTLTSTGSIAETTGIISASLLTTSSQGGQFLKGDNNGVRRNTVSAFTATNINPGTPVLLLNTAATLTVQNITNRTGQVAAAPTNVNGDNILVDNVGAVNIVGSLVSGSTGPVVLGGDITVNSTALLHLTAAGNVSSASGSGGTLTIGSNVLINGSLAVGFGDVTLNGGAGTLVINSPITVSSPLVLQATDDIIINSSVTTTTAGASITIRADLDENGAGGVLVRTAGSVNSAGNLTVSGSDLIIATPAGSPDGVFVESDGPNAQLLAVGNVLTRLTNVAPPGSQIWLGGFVSSSQTGSITFDDPVFVFGADARLITHGAGDVLFVETIDGAADLRIATDSGIVTFQGAVGGATPLGNVTVDNGLTVRTVAGFNAQSFTVNTIPGTILIGGPLNATGAGTNLSLMGATLVIAGPVNGNAGNMALTTDNISIESTIGGTGALLLQPLTTNRSIGINGTGDFNLTATEAGLIQAGLSGVTIGRANGTGIVNIGNLGPVTFHSSVLIQSPSGSGLMNLLNQVNTDTLGAGVELKAATINANVPSVPAVFTNSGAIALTGGVKLLTNTALDSRGPATLGSAIVSQTGSINGGFAFTANAGLSGTININGREIANPEGASIGQTPLTSFTLDAGNINIKPTVRTIGNQTYTVPSTPGSAIHLLNSPLSSSTGSITFNGAVVSHLTNLIATGTGNIVFNGTIDASAPGVGTPVLKATLGNIIFNGNIGSTTPLLGLQLEANGPAGSIIFAAGHASLSTGTLEVKTANPIAFKAIAATGNITITAPEVDFVSGANSVDGAGVLKIQTIAPTQPLRVGGAEGAVPGALTLSSTDLAALQDGFTEIDFVRTKGTESIFIAGGLSFSDPVVFQQAKGKGVINLAGPLTGTGNASFAFAGGAVTNIGGNITTAGGDIRFGAANYSSNLAINSAGGDVTFTSNLLNTNLTQTSDLTVTAGAGDVTFGGKIANAKGAKTPGIISISSSGFTTLGSIAAEGLVSNGGGTTSLGGSITVNDTTPTLVSITDAVELHASTSIKAMRGGDITLGAVNSKLGKAYSLSLTSQPTVKSAPTGEILVNGSVGAVTALSSFTATSLGSSSGLDGSINVIGSIVAKAVKLTSRDIDVAGSVTTTSSQTYSGRTVDLGGSLTASALSLSTNQSINNSLPWIISGKATLKTPGTIVLDEPGSSFGSLSLKGLSATVIENDDIVIAGGKIIGATNLTSSAGSVLQSGAFSTQSLTASGQTITFGTGNLKVASLGQLDAVGDILIVRGAPKNLMITDTITSTGGDIVIVADYGRSKANIKNNAGGAPLSAPGDILVYSYSAAKTTALAGYGGLGLSVFPGLLRYSADPSKPGNPANIAGDFIVFAHA